MSLNTSAPGFPTFNEQGRGSATAGGQAGSVSAILRSASQSLRLLAVGLGLSLPAVHAAVADEIVAQGWSPAELRMLRSLHIDSLKPVPPDPSNRFADNPRAAALGERIFFDTRFSDNGQVACATCHQPDKYFTDDLALSKGIGETRRGAPSLIGTAYSPWLYWDGRRDSHWAQALVPIETPVEHGFDRRRVLGVIAADTDYRAAYEEVFGKLPGEADDEEAINRAFANTGKALAAFERSFLPAPSRFDAYVDALSEEGSAAEPELNPDELAGLRLFISETTQCTRCHNGPLFTNFGFHNIGLIRLQRGVRSYDVGRIKGVKEVLTDPFRCDGPHSDAKPGQCEEIEFIRTWGIELTGAFKVPTLRNVAATSPYMHDGRFQTLREVLEHYRKAPGGGLGHQELNALELTDLQLDQIIAFLGTLTGPAPSAPPSASQSATQ